jgi:hypothetical protein
LHRRFVLALYRLEVSGRSFGSVEMIAFLDQVRRRHDRPLFDRVGPTLRHPPVVELDLFVD